MHKEMRMRRLSVIAIALVGLGALAIMTCAAGASDVAHNRAELKAFCDLRHGEYHENGRVFLCGWHDAGLHAIACIVEGYCIRDQAADGLTVVQATRAAGRGPAAPDRFGEAPFDRAGAGRPD